MIKSFWLCFLYFVTMVLANAKVINYSFKDYKEASVAQNFLKFNGSSTKFKIVTTEFDGFSKNFSLTYDIQKGFLENVKFTIDASSFDTDSSSRDEKLREKCLLAEQFKEIKAELVGKLALKEATDLTMEFNLTIKDKTITRPLKLSLIKTEGGYRVTFSSDFSFVEAGIEDPSILVAKVHETFYLSGSTEINI